MYELQDDFLLLRKRRRRRLLWGTVLVLLLVAGGYYAYLTYFPTETATPVEEPTLATATVRRGDLVLGVDGVGNLLPTNELCLGLGGDLLRLLSSYPSSPARPN